MKIHRLGHVRPLALLVPYDLPCYLPKGRGTIPLNNENNNSKRNKA